MYDRWFTIALLTSGFGQVWAKLRLQKSRTTLGEIVRLHNCAVADKGPFDEYYRDLGKSGQSMCHDVTPQLWRRLEGKRSIQGNNCNKDVTSR